MPPHIQGFNVYLMRYPNDFRTRFYAIRSTKIYHEQSAVSIS
jgi:hypothetical protein